MPRRASLNVQNSHVQCPKCLGSGQAWAALIEALAICSLCDGTGRVPPALAARWSARRAADPTFDTQDAHTDSYDPLDP
jgi:hypothetical protein